jgi:hypothetical protein
MLSWQKLSGDRVRLPDSEVTYTEYSLFELLSISSGDRVRLPDSEVTYTEYSLFELNGFQSRAGTGSANSLPDQ